MPQPVTPASAVPAAQRAAATASSGPKWRTQVAICASVRPGTLAAASATAATCSRQRPGSLPAAICGATKTSAWITPRATSPSQTATVRRA